MAQPEYVQTGLQTTDDLAVMLYYQAEAIWPQEEKLLQQYNLPKDSSLKILDLGCGSGEITLRLAVLFPNAEVYGVDLEQRNVDACNQRVTRHSNTGLVSRVHFQTGSGYDLKDLKDSTFHLTVCRSMLHTVSTPEKIIQQMIRVTTEGGFVHMLNEDYGMLWGHPTQYGDKLWRDGAISFFNNTGCDGLFGRNCYHVVKQLADKKVKHIDINYICVDTVRVNREIVYGIIKSWRDGYSKVIATHSHIKDEHEVIKYWDDILQCIHNENGYFCWQLVVCTLKL